MWLLLETFVQTDLIENLVNNYRSFYKRPAAAADGRVKAEEQRLQKQIVYVVDRAVACYTAEVNTTLRAVAFEKMATVKV